jgi:mersacidin/lichenicidin family type 2 lantibiotic
VAAASRGLDQIGIASITREVNMFKIDIVRAWKDEEYRQSLSEAEIAELPEHPSGLIELSDEDMAAASGGTHSSSSSTNLVALNNKGDIYTGFVNRQIAQPVMRLN